MRHGQTEYTKLGGVPAGHIDVPLTEEGIAQIEKMSSDISVDLDEIYSSDLIRCKKTSEIINQKFNLKIIYDSRLRTRDLGSIAGKKFNEIDPTGKMLEKDRSQQYNYRRYGGEAVEDVLKRLNSFLREIQTNKKNKKILVVTSDRIISLLYYMFNGEACKIIKVTSLHEFEFLENFFYITKEEVSYTLKNNEVSIKNNI